MNVKELTEKMSLKKIAVSEPQREINGAYIGDLLSFVMGRAGAGNIWITIMSNINIVAVASLADVSCIILAESVSVDESVIKAADERGVNILSSDKTAYEISCELSGLI